jgi:hypothetical protein
LKDHLIAAGFKNIEVNGQRQQIFFLNPFLEKQYKQLFKPSKRVSATVQPLKKGLEPEYFVMVAEK